MIRLLLLATILLPGAAVAHEDGGTAIGFVSGLRHPVNGIDHLVAMVAVGIWGAILRRPLVVALPVTFPVLMALGALIAIMGLPVPSVRLVIAASALLLGIAILLRLRPPLALAVASVGLFGLFHGYAHGVEAPFAGDPLGFVAGFVVGTGLLHLVGIAIGESIRHSDAARAAFAASGAVISAFGIVFLWNVVGPV